MGHLFFIDFQPGELEDNEISLVKNELEKNNKRQKTRPIFVPFRYRGLLRICHRRILRPSERWRSAVHQEVLRRVIGIRRYDCVEP
jgi:hypothetical protein